MKILTHRSCIVSAKLLRDHLSALIGRAIRVTTNPARINGQFIRYGSAAPVAVPDTQFNSQAFVQLASNKSAFSALLKDHGIPTPIFYRTTQPTAAQYPVLIRKTLNSSGGRGIVVCPNAATFAANWAPAYVWTPFIKTQFELRVHVLGGEVVKVFKKRFVGVGGAEEATELAEPALPIRNLDKGYHYSARELDTYPKVHELVDKLHPHIGTPAFYTLDIGWDHAKKHYFVFEANSGSGLNTQTVELYADYLARALMA